MDYVTLEMTAQQQVRRMLSAKAELNTQAIRSGFRDLSGPLGPEEIDEEQFARFSRAVEELNGELGPTVYLQEQGLSVEELQDHLIQVVSSRDCRCCLVDQLDLFAEPRPRLEQEQIAHISKTLKQLAKDLHIVLLCLVQLNRAVEHRTALLDRRPILSDLRYSGRLEQDADTVLFVHQPCLYQATYPLPPKGAQPALEPVHRGDCRQGARWHCRARSCRCALPAASPPSPIGRAHGNCRSLMSELAGGLLSIRHPWLLLRR